MFCNFCEKFENSNWLPFLARQKFFENWNGYSAEIPFRSKFSSKSLYLVRFSRYKHFCVLQFFSKNSKIHNGRQFWRDKNFYPAEVSCGLKILSKSLYLARFLRYKHFCVFLIWKICNDPFQVIIRTSLPIEKRHFWSYDLCDWLKCHCRISKKNPQGYCIHLPNLKGICQMVTEL